MLTVEYGNSLRYDEIKHCSEVVRTLTDNAFESPQKVHTRSKSKVDNLLINSSPTTFCVHTIVRCLSHIARHLTSKQHREAGNLK
jgi:hypothetical protein